MAAAVAGLALGAPFLMEEDTMSTEYYRFVPPFTSIRIDEDATYDRVTVFEKNANCGVLTVTRGLGRAVALLFRHDEAHPVLRTYWGGNDQGCQVEECAYFLHDDEYVVSEYGEVSTVAEVKAKRGKGRDESTYPSPS